MIGEMNHRLTIEEEVRTADGGGGFTSAWQSVAENPEVYAAITPVSGLEVLAFHQLGAVATHKIILRARDDLTPAHRLVKGDAVYDIISLQAPEPGSFLEILARRRVL